MTANPKLADTLNELALKAHIEALASPELTGATRQAVERQHRASQETLRKLQQLKGLESG